MLISLRKYRLNYAFSVFLSISILGALLMSRFVRISGYSQTDLTFAMTMIIFGVTYAAVRDAVGAFAYAVESTKFYRNEADFELLKSYIFGWRRIAVLLARPVPSATLMAAAFIGLQQLYMALWSIIPSPALLVTTLLVAFFFPIALSTLIYFLSPVFVGWKELNAFGKALIPMGPISAARLIREIALADMLVTMMINVALVMVVRYDPDFSLSLGYGSLEFVVAALIMTTVVVTLSLLGSWRTRVHACSGDLYRSPGMALSELVLPRFTGNRWLRWFQYCLVMCGFTVVACLLVNAVYATAPIQVVLLLLLLPVAPIFWIERNAMLASNFRDASQLVIEFPARMPAHERIKLTSPQ